MNSANNSSFFLKFVQKTVDFFDFNKKMAKIVEWYYVKFRTSEAREMSQFLYKEKVDLFIWSSLFQLSGWAGARVINGLLIWYALRFTFFPTLPLYTFLGFGILTWYVWNFTKMARTGVE